MAAKDIHDTIMDMYNALNDDTIKTSPADSNVPGDTPGDHSIIDAYQIYDAGDSIPNTDIGTNNTASQDAVDDRQDNGVKTTTPKDDNIANLRADSGSDLFPSDVSVPAISDEESSLGTITSEQESDDDSASSSDPYDLEWNKNISHWIFMQRVNIINI